MAKNVVTLRQGPYGVKDDDDMFESDVSISKMYMHRISRDCF